MTKLFSLEIYTPDRTFFTGEVESLVVNTDSGSVGILYNTLPIVSIVDVGIMKILHNNKWSEAICGEGVVSVSKQMVSVLVEYAKWPHEIDYELLDREIDDYMEKRERSLLEYKMAKATLALQFAKLKKKDF